MSSGLMTGKRGLIMGLANEKSIAWGIAKSCFEAGAEMAFSYQGDALKKRVGPLAERVGSNFLVECDVSDETSVANLFSEIKKEWGQLDFLVHAIGFSDKSELRGRYIDTSFENFNMTMNISVYSFTAVASHAEKLMPNGGSMLTLTYFGAEQVMPHYNVMGVAKAALESSVRYLAADLGPSNIRVNALSAGPMKTLAMAGISGGKDMMKWSEKNSLMNRNINLEDVGKSGLYLLSDMSSGVTGEVHYVDCGYNKVGVPKEI